MKESLFFLLTLRERKRRDLRGLEIEIEGGWVWVNTSRRPIPTDEDEDEVFDVVFKRERKGA